MRLSYVVLTPHGLVDNPLKYQHEHDSGFDLQCASRTPITLKPGEVALVPTGIAFSSIPEGYEVQIRPRSGLAVKHALTVLNAPGTIDRGYTGEVKVVLINHGKMPVTIARCMRIAQAVLAPVVQAELVQVEAVEASERGSGGFGSTGV